jgi:dipeptidyl aminopeptidase/acylaminoacyl peptidase
MVIRGDRSTLALTGTVRGDSLVGVLREGQGEGRFAFARALDAGVAFQEREITFTSGDVRLAGSLILPEIGDSLPAVVFLHGSGAEGRWASRFLATQFARRGIAALIFDKRGVGGSSGDWRQATLDDLTGDGIAAVARLLEESRIDHGRIGIHGHSQGGTLAPVVAVRSGHVSFVIGSAAAGMPTDSTEMFSILNSVYPRAASPEDSAMARWYVSELVAVAYHGRARQRLDSLVTAFRERSWFFAPPAADNSYWSFSRQFAQYRALDWWARVRVPVLLIYGAEDQRVPAAESAARIAATLLRNTPDADVTVRVLAGADHTFRLPPGSSGWPVTAPDYLPSLFNWLTLRR